MVVMRVVRKVGMRVEMVALLVGKTDLKTAAYWDAMMAAKVVEMVA